MAMHMTHCTPNYLYCSNSTTLVKVKDLREERIGPLALELRIQGGMDHWKTKVTRAPSALQPFNIHM